jgi:hypothetical protein
MHIAITAREETVPLPRLTAARPRMLLVLCVVIALVGVLAAPGNAAAALADPDLTRLLRAMAGLKALAAAGAIAAAWWRLGAPVTWLRFAAYALASAAMAVGPGLIWQMAHVVIGALLLHGGLLAAIVLLWRDPAMGARLAELLAARRAGGVA